MHEVAIAQSIVDLAEQEARRADAKRVLSISVSLGDLSGVLEHYLQYCFPLVSKGTMAEDAELLVERVVGRGFCAACDAEFDMPEMLTPCPTCEQFARRIVAGQELSVTSLEVE